MSNSSILGTIATKFRLETPQFFLALLPESLTAKAREIYRGPKRKGSSSNYLFSGVNSLLNLGGVSLKEKQKKDHQFLLVESS